VNSILLLQEPELITDIKFLHSSKQRKASF